MNNIKKNAIEPLNSSKNKLNNNKNKLNSKKKQKLTF